MTTTLIEGNSRSAKNHPNDRSSDQNAVNWKNLAVIFAFLIQFGGLVWGAAVLYAQVQVIKEDQSASRTIQQGLAEVVHNMQIIQAVQTEQILQLKAKR